MRFGEKKMGGGKNCSVSPRSGASLFSWPWENLGSFKYLLYGPIVANAIHAIHRGEIKNHAWSFHILILFGFRALVHQLWGSYSLMLYLNRNRRINQEGVEFKQIDAEWHWDNFLMLQAIAASLLCLCFPSSNLPIFDSRGFICCLILHIAISEPLYYWLHRLLHSPALFQNYHWLHHSSKVLHPFTAGHATFLEHLLLCVVVGTPILATTFIGLGSISLIYGYLFVFDFLQCLRHCNVEIFPSHLFDDFPLLKSLICTPIYHSLHHTHMKSNFCLFMPLYDTLWKTTNTKSWDLQKEISARTSDRFSCAFLSAVALTSVLFINYYFCYPILFETKYEWHYKMKRVLIKITLT